MNRKLSQKSTTLILATSVSLTTALLIALYYFFPNLNIFIYSIICSLISFISAYIIIFYSIHFFVMDRIKPIYKTIGSITPKKLSIYESADNIDIIFDIQEKVLKWAKNKTKEIVILKESAKYRKEFLGNVSHELKTPLFNLQGMVLTLLDGGIHDSFINIKYLERCDKNINRLISIVQDLETISKLETGELKLNFSIFDICELITDVLDIHEIKALDKKIVLKLNKDSSTDYFVLADKKRIFEVVSNLITNSINYGKNFGLTSIHIHDIDDKYLIEITDDGIGIPENDLARIFERFYRVDKSRSTESGGTGLGLSIVKHIVEAHDEAINVKSNLNSGTTFSFSLKKHSKNYKNERTN